MKLLDGEFKAEETIIVGVDADGNISFSK